MICLFEFNSKSVRKIPMFQIGGLFRTTDLKRSFSKDDTTHWSYNLYTITVIINDTIPGYKIGQLPQVQNEALIKKPKQTTEKNDRV